MEPRDDDLGDLIEMRADALSSDAENALMALKHGLGAGISMSE